jgi:hypothetical protein
MSNDFNERLEGMQEAWASGRDREPGAPAGTYKAQVQDLQLAVAQSSGNMMINREFLIIEGEQNGEVVYDRLMLETERGPYYVGRFIDQMGYEKPDAVTEIPGVLAAIVEEAPVVMLNVRKNDDFTNARVLEVLQGEEGEPAAKEAPDESPKEAVDSDVRLSEGQLVKYEDEGEMKVGKVVGFADGDVHIEDSEAAVWAFKPVEVFVIEEDDEPPVEETMTQLIAFAGAYDIEVSDQMDGSEIVAAVKEYEWDAAELTDDEVELLGGFDIPVKPKPKSKAAKAAPKKATKKKGVPAAKRKK